MPAIHKTTSVSAGWPYNIDFLFLHCCELWKEVHIKRFHWWFRIEYAHHGWFEFLRSHIRVLAKCTKYDQRLIGCCVQDLCEAICSKILKPTLQACLKSYAGLSYFSNVQWPLFT